MAKSNLTQESVQASAGAGRFAARSVFNAIGGAGADTLTPDQILRGLAVTGIRRDDPRLRQTVAALSAVSDRESISETDFAEHYLHPDNAALIQRAVKGDLVVPEFARFEERLARLFDFCRDYRDGAVADYIPQLARVDPERYAMSVCTVDGQRASFGDYDEPFCAQSTCKPVNYAIALEQYGVDVVHRHVGREPSGQSFNEITLNKRGLPHNPMINAGAIMCAALIKPTQPLSDRFDYVMNVWRALAGGERCGFDNSVYHSEKDTADRNFALAYFMREKGAFPEGADMQAALDFYFQCCSITLTTRQMAVVAATLANGGMCPLTGQRVFNTETVKNCLSLMYSCGMYDFSGEYAFTVGLPAKSGVSGALYIVIPELGGIAIWSPRLDAQGNSVRGVEFSKRLVETFPFHTYAGVVGEKAGRDPRKSDSHQDTDQGFRLCWAAARGDVDAVRRLAASGVDLDTADYDGRTALHLAACEGQTEIVRFLLNQTVKPDPQDRWGNTPLDEARSQGRREAVALLQAALGPAS